MNENQFPGPLRSLSKLVLEYFDSDGIDFEPYETFLSKEEADDWLKLWTGNKSANAQNYRVFGQDGTGGLAAIWAVRPGSTLLEQPIVFFGSEGELGVVASCFADYLWLLAQGVGPFEAVAYGAGLGQNYSVYEEFACQHAPDNERPASEILESAKSEYPGFEDEVRGLCT
jgi:hypothetical protein